MNNYITLDERRYFTPFGNWNPVANYPSTVRPQWDGHLDATWGPMSFQEWNGEIRIDVTRPSDDPAPPNNVWGTEADLLATMAKAELVEFTDHDGNSFNVAVQGPFRKRALSPRWDGEGSVLFYTIRILADSAI